MNKWERLNSELADARHYADDMKERLDTVPAEAIRKLRAHLSTDGDYSISRTDGAGMFIGEVIMLGDLFEKIDAWLDADAVKDVKA